MLPKFKRVLLKLSGESLMGDNNFGLDSKVIARYAQDIKSIINLGVQVAIVIGGGNIYRGMNEAETGIERAGVGHANRDAAIARPAHDESLEELVGFRRKGDGLVSSAQFARVEIEHEPTKRNPIVHCSPVAMNKSPSRRRYE